MTIVTGQEPHQEILQPRREFFRQLLGNKKLVVGLAVFLVLTLVPLLAGAVVDPALRSTGSLPARQPPSPAAPLGTDNLGRSIFVQMTEAMPNSLQVGLIAATLGTLIGAIVGFVSGYFGGIVDTLLRI